MTERLLRPRTHELSCWGCATGCLLSELKDRAEAYRETANEFGKQLGRARELQSGSGAEGQAGRDIVSAFMVNTALAQSAEVAREKLQRSEFLSRPNILFGCEASAKISTTPKSGEVFWKPQPNRRKPRK